MQPLPLQLCKRKLKKALEGGAENPILKSKQIPEIFHTLSALEVGELGCGGFSAGRDRQAAQVGLEQGLG